MKESIENTREPQRETVQRVEQELSTGGESNIKDNRPSSSIQRKLRLGIDGFINGKNPIKRKNNTGLPDNLKSGIENLSGYSMDDVKVHYNSNKPAQLQAHAYAQGTDIHLAPGQERHLPHEAWHVVQQKQGRVKPTMQFKGKVSINDDAVLEKEADVMGELVLQKKQIPADTKGIRTVGKSEFLKGSQRSSSVTQRLSWEDWASSIGNDTKRRRLKEWDHYAKYLKHALGGKVATAEKKAKVRKNRALQENKPARMSRQDWDYIQNFEIISREEFNQKCNEIATAIADFSINGDPYICVVSSNTKKSNFWLTAKILKMVKSKGGHKPDRIVRSDNIESVRAIAMEDTAILANANRQKNLGNIQNNTKIVFIDDAMYSGTQSTNFIRNFWTYKNDIRLGFVAASDDAKNLLNIPNNQYLATPISIRKQEKSSSNNRVMNPIQAIQSLNAPISENGFNTEQRFMTGMYYKMPDGDSVKNSLLLTGDGKTNVPPFVGYVNDTEQEHYKRRELNQAEKVEMLQNIEVI
ncbi:eCIS core domain-containing protein [Aquimarina rubra]|uniref:DUF4157 domain-containing protein n=1 Tax=Aquimarina rubra TaxID=1920033 RepID=A0ABW5LF03_9FLAO